MVHSLMLLPLEVAGDMEDTTTFAVPETTSNETAIH